MKTKGLIITLSALGISYLAAGYIGLQYTFRRKKYKLKHSASIKHPLSQEEKDYIHSLKKEHLEIRSFDGLILRGLYIPSEKPSKNVVICVHGYHSNGLTEYQYFLRFYHEHNFNILLPDNRAHGESEGKYIGFSYLDRLDLMQWIFKIQQIFDHKPLNIMLHGISMGASTVLMASGEELSSDVKCIIADCGYASATEQFYRVLKDHHLPPKIILSSAGLLSKKVIGYDYRLIDVVNKVRHSHTPTLFIHGDKDEFVDVKMAEELFNACSAPKQLFIVKGAAHDDSYLTNKEGYEEHVLSFASKYMNLD